MTLPAEVPRTKRVLQAFFFAPLFCLTISGVVFGFAGEIPFHSFEESSADNDFIQLLSPFSLARGFTAVIALPKKLKSVKEYV